MLVDMTLQGFVSSADLAIAISIAALSVSALRGGRRPRRMRSWLFFALASLGVEIVQGYLYGPEVTPAELRTLIRRPGASPL